MKREFSIFVAVSLSIQFCYCKHYAKKITSNTGENGSEPEKLAKREFNLDAEKLLAAFHETVIGGFLHYDEIEPKLSAATRTTLGLKKFSTLLTSKPIGIATSWLLTVITMRRRKKMSPWDEVNDKVERIIREKVIVKDIESLKTQFNEIKSIMEIAKFSRGEKFTKTDLKRIRDKAVHFFPQTYNANDFTRRWPEQTWKYLLTWLAAIIDIVNKEGYKDKCMIGWEVDLFRPEILDACKKLAKGRYSTLETVDYDGAVLRWGASTTPMTDAKLTFRDPLGKNVDYDRIPLNQVKNRVIEEIQDDVAVWLQENLITRFNSLYNEVFVPRECYQVRSNYPPLIGPIGLQEIEETIKWNQECMGQTTGYDGVLRNCTLPCGNYDSEKKEPGVSVLPWCVWFPNHEITKNDWYEGQNESVDSNKRYMQCTKSNWKKCLNTDGNKLATRGDYADINKKDEDKTKAKKNSKKDREAVGKRNKVKQKRKKKGKKHKQDLMEEEKRQKVQADMDEKINGKDGKKEKQKKQKSSDKAKELFKWEHKMIEDMKEKMHNLHKAAQASKGKKNEKTKTSAKPAQKLAQ